MIIVERELKPLILNPLPNITRVKDEETEDKLIEFLEKNDDFGFDAETTPVDNFYWRRMRTMQFGNSNEQYVIDLKEYTNKDADLLYKCQGEYGKHLYLAPKLQKLLVKLSKYICTNKKIKSGVHLGFEYECFYWMFGIRIWGLYDCMLAEKCIYAGLGGSSSLKNFSFYSMEEMMERYYGVSIDKTLQTSFNLENDLTDAQFEYAALDTRTPLAIKLLQTIIANGETVTSLKAKGKPKLAEYLTYLDQLILGDNLHEVIQIENNAIGAFVDMHVHGENVDANIWMTRVNKAKAELTIVISNLDKIFLTVVGSKNEPIDEEKINLLDSQWRALNEKTEHETLIRSQINALNREIRKSTKQCAFNYVVEKTNEVKTLEAELNKWETARKEQKEILKLECRRLTKKRTQINNLKPLCEGEALVNYSSNSQLLNILTDVENEKYFPLLFKDERKNYVKTGNKLPILQNLDDEILEKYEHIPVIKLIREYHGLAKEVGTYGETWVTKWTTKPCKEEGWLHPGDGKLHCVFNQYEAETGRTSSEKPNGQNLPQGDEVRSAFVADPPDENIRISNCCNADTTQISPNGFMCNECNHAFTFAETHPEEYVLITADMSGAELRIIADDSGDEQWIGSFERGEDLHSAGTDLLYEDEWKKETLPNCAYYVLNDEQSVAKYPKAIIGTPKKWKCKCPLHKERRDDTKAINFLLAYGGSAYTLATRIKKPFKKAKELMALHEQKNPGVWSYLDWSGKKAMQEHKAFDMFGRRRILPEPTPERVRENCLDWNEEELRLDSETCEKNINTFFQVKGKKPNKKETFILTHRDPTQNELAKSYYQMTNGVGRQGKNMRIQGTNASIAKVSVGCGFDKEGKPFLFHTLGQYKAKLVKFVHDELVTQSPKRFAQKVADLIGDAFRRAAALKLKRVEMEFEYAIASYWKK